VGVHGSACLVLDPHVMVQPAFTEASESNGGVLSVNMWPNGRGRVFGMDITQLDPSILLAFYLRNYNDWLALKRELTAFAEENPDLPHMLRIEEGEARNDDIPDELLDDVESLDSFPAFDTDLPSDRGGGRERGREGDEGEEDNDNENAEFPKEGTKSSPGDEFRSGFFLGSCSMGSTSSDPHVFVDTHGDLVFTQYAAPPPTDAIIVDTQKISHHDNNGQG